MTKKIDENLELLTLVWLDKFVDATEENRQIQEKLRSKIYHLKTFDNQNDFLSLIQNEKQLKLFLIVSGQYGRDLIEQIHPFSEIISIFVFCGNKQFNEVWANKYSKIRSVVVAIDELLNEIEKELKNDDRLLNEPIHLSNEINPIISLIYQIKSTPIVDQRSFLNVCFDYFQKNQHKLEQIYEFEHFYSIEKCFEWFFTRSFLYDLLKKSLSNLNIEMIYLLRFFVQNLDKQIHSSCVNKIICKGHLLTIDQIEYLMNLDVKQSFYFHNYFIFSSNQEKIIDLFNHRTHSNGLHKVLFRITLKNKSIGIYENEFVLPLFSSFRKTSMIFDKRIWFIDVEVNQQEFFVGQNQQFPIDLPNYLFNKHLFDESQQIYSLLFKQYPRLSSKICHALGLIQQNRGSPLDALQFHLKSFELSSKDDPLRCDYLNHIGILYDQLNDYQRALHFYFRALKKLTNKSCQMKIFNNIAITYAKQKQYEQSLKYFHKSLDLQQQFQIQLDFLHNNLGLIYFYLKDYQQASQQFSLALKLTQSDVFKQIILRNLDFLN